MRGTRLLLVLACAASLLVMACTGLIALTDVPNAGAGSDDASQTPDGAVESGEAGSGADGADASTLSISPASFAFATTEAGTKGPTQTFTVTNLTRASSPVLSTTVSPAAARSQFVIAKDACSGRSLGAMMSCDITVQFDPPTYGSMSALLSINGGQASATLTGIGEDSVKLSVVKTGAGSGTVTDASGSINCGSTCSAQFQRTTSDPVITLTASPAAASTFVGWSGPCSGAGKCFVTLSAATTVTAQFIPTPQTLTVNFRPIGAGVTGSIASSPAGIACSGPCTTSSSFPSGTPVTLTVTGVSSSALVGWLPTGCSGNTCMVTMSAAQTVSYTATGNNIVFVTSATHDGDLGGLAGAGAFCQAAAAGIGLPGHYVAWLATSTVNATTALGSARGWIRLDGLPFADTIGVAGGATGIVNGQIYYPPAIDDAGMALGSGSAAWSTPQDGSSYPGAMCSDWTSNSSGSQGVAGDPSSGSGQWAGSGIGHCDGLWSLYCLGTDLSTPVTVAAPTGRRAFISKGNFDPSTGLASADSLCQSEAAGAALPNASHFLALLASSSASPASRFNLGGANWQRPDGVAMASSVSDVISGNILAAVTQHADGSYIEQEGLVWTGATSKDLTVSGTPGSTCDNWTNSGAVDAGPYPAAGASDEATSSWIYGTGYYCNYAEPVYCFEN